MGNTIADSPVAICPSDSGSLPFKKSTSHQQRKACRPDHAIIALLEVTCAKPDNPGYSKLDEI